MREVIERKEWLGSIPKEWGYIPGRFVFKPRNSKGNETGVLLAATQKQGMYPQHLLEGVVQVREGTDLQSFRTVHKNDYVISLRSFQGGFEMSDYEGVCSPAYQVFYNSKPIDHRYYKYLFKSKGFIQEMDSVTVGIREGKNIPYESFARTYIPYPEVSEQSRIATFLDDRCAKIDEAIARHDALIKKLDEYRKAVITKAVKCCESDLRKLKFCVKLCTEKAETKDNYIALENIEGQTGKYIGNKILPDGEAVVTKRGYVLFGKLRPYLAKCYVTEQDGCCSGEFLVMNPQIVSARFLQYVLLEQTLVDKINMSTYGTKMPRANWGFIGNQLIPVPSPSEQQGIVAFLDKKCIAIDSAKERHTQLITKLEEYKKSLIYNAVTGKIEC